jgi:hypothetical protein
MKRTLVYRLLTAVATVAMVVTLSASPANAAVIIFDQNGGASGGNLSYDGAGGGAVGTNIVFDTVNVDGTILTCVGCVLNFTTGPNTIDTPFFWTWSGGGSFVITGQIIDPNNGNALVASGVLLSGSFSGPVPAFAAVGAGFAITMNGSGTDTKNADLLAYFGLSPNDFIYASTNITGEDCVSGAGNGFSCGVVTADVTNTEQPAPEPATLTLFGLGLLGVGTAARRRLTARK